jgi:hypothetical protein
LLFIAAVIAAVEVARRLPSPRLVSRTAFLAVTYAIGVMASFWFVERVAAF